MELGCGLPISFRASISILPYHESLPVPHTMLPCIFGWNCFSAFPSIWWFIAEGSLPLEGCIIYVFFSTLSYYVRKFKIHHYSSESKFPLIESSRPPNIYKLIKLNLLKYIYNYNLPGITILYLLWCYLNYLLI